MPQYILLLYQRKGPPPLSPEEMQPVIQKYMEWTRKAVSSLRIDNDFGRVIRSKNGAPEASDGPYSETAEILGGFYTIEAPSYDEAVRIAMTHPHIEYGGAIEVRKISGT